MTMTGASLGTNVRLGTGHRCEGGRYGDFALRRSDPLVWTVVVDIAGLHRDAASHLYATALGQEMDVQLIAALDRISDAIRSQSAGGMDIGDLKASVTELLQENGSADISGHVADMGSDFMRQMQSEGSDLAKLVSDDGVTRAAAKLESLKGVLADKGSELLKRVSEDGSLREASSLIDAASTHTAKDHAADIVRKIADKGSELLKRVSEDGVRRDTSSLVDAAANHAAKGHAADTVHKIVDKGSDLLNKASLSEKGASVSSLIDAGVSALKGASELKGSMTKSYFLGGTPFDLLTWSAARVYHATATFVRLMLSPPRPTQ